MLRDSHDARVRRVPVRSMRAAAAERSSRRPAEQKKAEEAGRGERSKRPHTGADRIAAPWKRARDTHGRLYRAGENYPKRAGADRRGGTHRGTAQSAKPTDPPRADARPEDLLLGGATADDFAAARSARCADDFAVRLGLSLQSCISIR